MFEVIEGWEQLPAGWEHPDTVSVAVDSNDRVYVFHRGAHPVLVYDRQGALLDSWGDGQFVGAHGITCGPDDSLYITDRDAHVVHNYSPAGQLLTTIGIAGTPSDTGAEGINYRSISRAAGPFNRPANVAVAPNGDLYVADGYANCRVHVFSSDGTLLRSWGEPGTGPGQFHLVHGIALDSQGRVFVCDRENDRIQIFSAHGDFLAQWNNVQHPTDIAIGADGRACVTELPWTAGAVKGTGETVTEFMPARITVLDAEGNVLTRFAAGDPLAPGTVAAPHGLALDSRGDLYVAEVCATGAQNGWGSEGAQTLQKFARVSA